MQREKYHPKAAYAVFATATGLLTAFAGVLLLIGWLGKIQLIVYLIFGMQMLLLAFIFLFLKRDIVGRRKAEGELKQLNEKLEEYVKERTASLAKSEKRYRSTLDSLMEGCQIIDFEYRYLYLNDAAVRQGQNTKEELLGHTMMEMYPGFETTLMFDKLRKCMADKVHQEMGNELDYPDGSKAWFDLHMEPVNEGVFILSMDITGRKRVEEEIRKLNESLEQKVIERTEQYEASDKAKSEFLANMSHEIRTPMNAVLGYAELLGFMLEDKTQKDYIEAIKSSGRSLLTLINDILDLSKIEAGKLELQFEFVNSHSFFSELERIFSLRVSEKGLKFILDITSGTPAGIYIDEVRLRQIMFNIIGNAIKFTRKGHIKLKVYTENPHIVNYNRDKSEQLIDLVIEIEDTGIGISREFQKEIFEPFTQQPEQKQYGGTGLGLAITRGLTALMNGTINLQSKLKKGSTFQVKIPDVAYVREFEKSTAEIHIDPADIVFEKATIIVADDVEHNRKYLKDALKNTNITVVEAEDGRKAFNLAKKIIPDLIIADIRMPKLDGFGLLSKIKSDDALKHIPMIAYSASVMKDQKERIGESAFTGLLIKPVQISELYIELMNNLPYKSTRAPELDKSVAENKLMEEVHNLPGLIHSLETGFNDIWKTFAIRQPIGEVREFGKELINLGKEHNAVVITGYGEELKHAADSYNIEAILKLISIYPGTIEKLKDYSKSGLTT